MTAEDDDEVWLDEETVAEVAEKLLLEVFSPAVEARVKKLMNETIIDAIHHYVKEGDASLSGKDTDLLVLFSVPEPPLDKVENIKPLIEMLEDEIQMFVHRDWRGALIDYDPPDDDEDAPRIRLLRALIKAYDANGGTR